MDLDTLTNKELKDMAKKMENDFESHKSTIAEEIKKMQICSEQFEKINAILNKREGKKK